uniref:Ig-like domain-containing protein n=1 Tax=Pygocentrus nattereri TaxID=42514 RepID=A0AAR2JCL5_PYGNA
KHFIHCVTRLLNRELEQLNSVSVSPPGEIVEGSSVTLTCYSLINSTVNYTWFRGTTFLGTTRSYRIYSIRAEDSGEYMCKHGSAFSEYTPLDILCKYVFKMSVTLTCKAHTNPPVMDYIWYKEGESEPVAYGQTYSITSITKEDIAPFYCKAGNRIGHDYARPVPVTCIGEQRYHPNLFHKYIPKASLNLLLHPHPIFIKVAQTGQCGLEGSTTCCEP